MLNYTDLCSTCVEQKKWHEVFHFENKKKYQVHF